MYVTYDYLDGFNALFGNKSVIFPKSSFPFGAATVDILNLDEAFLKELEDASLEAWRDMQGFLSGDDDASAAGFAQASYDTFFSLLRKLPAYSELEPLRGKAVSALRRYPDVRERIQTKGTDEQKETHEWLENLRGFAPRLREFRNKAIELLEECFSDVPERTASLYAQRLSGYYKHIEIERLYLSDDIDQRDLSGDDFLSLREDYQRDLDRKYLPTHFQIHVTYRTVPDPKKTDSFILAEEIFFTDYVTFLSLDLIRGFAAGHLPRRCDNCSRWFLLQNGFDTRYCENQAPGEKEGKTCRSVGPHNKEKRLNGSEDIRQEYIRVSNRLKGQKYRGTLSVDDWNRYMKYIVELRKDASAGKLKLSELIEKYDAVSNRRPKPRG